MAGIAGGLVQAAAKSTPYAAAVPLRATRSGNRAGMVRQPEVQEASEGLQVPWSFGQTSLFSEGERSAGTKGVTSRMIQRKCACQEKGAVECAECKKKRLQTKLTMGSSADPLEHEADRVAEQVLHGGALQRVTPTGADVQRDAQAEEAAFDRGQHAPDSVEQALATSGKPLETGLKIELEGRFGYRFGDVRIHQGEAAERSARDVNALAYTVGRDIVFGAGQFAPRTHPGQRLLAHELTHVVQQTQGIGSGQRVARQVQRDTGWYPMTVGDGKPGRGPGSSLTHAQQNADSEDAVYFYNPAANRHALRCQSNCHEQGKQYVNPNYAIVSRKRAVDVENLLDWAADQVWTLHGENTRVRSMLMRREDAKLHALWDVYKPGLTAMVRGGRPEYIDTYFEGPAKLRDGFARYLESNWSLVDKDLDRRANARLVQEIEATLHTRRIPAGATLVADPRVVVMVEDHPAREQVYIGRDFAHSTVTVGWEWLGKRLRSVSQTDLIFELIDNPGIYFHMSGTDFQKGDPELGKVAEKVTKNTKGMAWVGLAVKGFLNGLASPVMLAVDTAAKLEDMETQAEAAFGKWTGWYSMGYTCWSSTCKQYEDCVGDDWDGDTTDCKDKALGAAMEEATILIPLYKQGAQCLDGDAESCGGIAAMALGLAADGVGKLTPELEAAGGKGKVPEAAGHGTNQPSAVSASKFEEAAIRETIDRPLEGDRALEKAVKQPEVQGTKGHGDAVPEKPAGKGIAADGARLAKGVMEEDTVHAAAHAAGAEVPLGDGTHGVAAYGEGAEMGFDFCSRACGLVRNKLAQFERVLPKGSALARDVNFLWEKTKGLDRQLQKGMSKTAEAAASREIAANLKSLAKSDPTLSSMLEMTPEEIRKNAATLRKKLADSPEFVDTEQARAARIDAAEKGNQAQNRKYRAEIDPETDADVEQAFEQQLRSKDPGKTSYSTASADHPIAQDIGIHIDEEKAVKAPGTLAEQRERATDLNDRGFREAIDNRAKGIKDDPRAIERLSTVREPVSLVMEEMRDGKMAPKMGGEYLALWDRRFSEIVEMKKIGDDILNEMKGKKTRDPGKLKAELNGKIWEEVQHPKTAEGRIVAEAVQRSGFGVVEVRGVKVLRALKAQELRARGLRYKAGQGWVKR